jgi:PAS domain S-box-containing protein
MDIDKKKYTQNQLVIMSNIVHNSPNFISYKKINGECLYVNPAASFITGYTEDELKKDYLGSLFDDATAKQLSEHVINDLHDNGISHFEAKFKTKDGETRLFEGTSFLIEKDAFGSIASDVTEVKKLESEKIEALNSMKNILDELDAIIYVTDPDTSEILFMNNSMRRHYGIDGDVVGHLCYKLLQRGMDERCDFCPRHKLDKEPGSVIVWEITDSLTNRIHRKTDRYIKWPDGKTVPLQHSVDITDLTQANEYNRQIAEELKIALLETQDANRAKSDFLARMSHEMLTPMNAIMGMIQLIAMQDIPGNFKKEHGEIEKASRNLLKLI